MSDRVRYRQTKLHLLQNRDNLLQPKNASPS
jgi:hypothetical protein